MERGVVVEEEEEATLTPNQLLQLAETHLRVRNFSLCRQYALESQQPDDPQRHTNQRRAAQLAAVADIHLASTAAPGVINWYSILQVDTFSDDHNLIRSQFKKLLLLLDPIKDKFALAKEALNLLHKAHSSLLNPSQKAQLDSQLSLLLSNQKYVNLDQGQGQGEGEGSFWTFCPYCFYVYQYAKVYEGCCLRCQNETCRRAFHGVALCSLPRTDLEKGQYFSCFGYFPLGFSPSECQGKGRFSSWSPIVGLFPVKRIGKTCAGRMDYDGVDDDIVEILDESDESESPAYDNENVGTNMDDGQNAAQPRMMKRKSVAWNAKNLMSKRRSNEGANGSGVRSDFDEYGNGDDNDDGTYDDVENMPADVAGRSGCDLETDGMKFFEEDGEIFVGLGPDPDDAF